MDLVAVSRLLEYAYLPKEQGLDTIGNRKSDKQLKGSIEFHNVEMRY
jgi:hypothetical protein